MLFLQDVATILWDMFVKMLLPLADVVLLRVFVQVPLSTGRVADERVAEVYDGLRSDDKY